MSARVRYPADASDDRLGSSFVHFTFLGDDGSSSGQDSITMYIPQGLNFSDGVNYDRSDFGIIGNAVEAGVDEMVSRQRTDPRSRAPSLRNMASDVISGATDMFSEITGTNFGDQNTIAAAAGVGIPAAVAALIAGVAGRNIGLSGSLGAVAGGALGASSVADAALLASGQVFNPNTKTVFRAVGTRQFSLSFPMIAESREEAVNISLISRIFRQHMYPSRLSSGSEYQLMLKYPKKVLVEFYTSAGNDDMTPLPKYKFKPCFITNVNRSINPTSPSYHEDGQPVETTLTISFMEESILTSEDISAGF